MLASCCCAPEEAAYVPATPMGDAEPGLGSWLQGAAVRSVPLPLKPTDINRKPPGEWALPWLGWEEGLRLYNLHHPSASLQHPGPWGRLDTPWPPPPACCTWPLAWRAASGVVAGVKVKATARACGRCPNLPQPCLPEHGGASGLLGCHALRVQGTLAPRPPQNSSTVLQVG